jgi:hypothetical protein
LEDGVVLSTLNIDEKKFIVCLVTKPKDAPLDVTPADPTDVPAPAETAQPEPAPRRYNLKMSGIALYMVLKI